MDAVLQSTILKLIKIISRFEDVLPEQASFDNSKICRERWQLVINLRHKRLKFALKELHNKICFLEEPIVYGSDFNTKTICRVLNGVLKIEITCSQVILSCKSIIATEDVYYPFGIINNYSLLPVADNELEKRLDSFLSKRT